METDGDLTNFIEAEKLDINAVVNERDEAEVDDENNKRTEADSSNMSDNARESESYDTTAQINESDLQFRGTQENGEEGNGINSTTGDKDDDGGNNSVGLNEEKEIDNIDSDNLAEFASIDQEHTEHESSKKDCTKEEFIKEDLTRTDSSKIDIEELGYVDVTMSDLEEKEGGRISKPKFEIEEEEGSDEVFSEFVDRISVLNGGKADSDITGSETEADSEVIMQYLRKHQYKPLKMSLRNSLWGVKHEIRKDLWYNLCHYLHKADADDVDMFSEFAEDLFTPGDHSDIRIPSFVDMEHLNSYHLNEEGVQSARKILCVLEHSCPDIIYSPLLFSLLCMFLHYMDTSQCYNCIYSLLRTKDGGYLPTTKVSFEASKLVIRDLAKKYAKSGYVYLVRSSSNIDQVFDSWLWWLFEDLPFSYQVKVIDCYLREGIKIFYRVALAIVIQFAKTYAKKSSSPKKDSSAGGNVTQSLRLFCREMPVKVDKLLKTCFGIRGFNRKEIRKLQVKHEMYINSTKHITNVNETQPGGLLSMSRSFSGPIVLQNLGTDTLTADMVRNGPRLSILITELMEPVRSSTDSHMTEKEKLYAILKWIPTRYAICQPELLYTSEEHGTSLVTLYQRVENYQPTILVIKTTQDEVFGAYCSSCWRDRRQKSQLLSYFGTGETFLFTLRPEKRKYEWVGLTQENIPNTASMFQAGDRSILTVGGGHGEAISLDENLLHCRTEKCDTFDNEPLSISEDFQCKVVEVYGFV